MLNVLLRAEGGGDCDGRAGGQRRPSRAAARADRRVRRRLAQPRRRARYRPLPGPEGQSWIVPQPLRRRSRPLRRRRLWRAARPATLVRRAGARRPRRQLCRSATRSTGSRRSAATRWSSAAAATRASASPPSSLRGARARGSATSSPCPPRPRARPEATPSSSARTTPDGASGMLGLPVAQPVEAAYQRFFGSAAAMLFLRRDDRRFAPAGELDAADARSRRRRLQGVLRRLVRQCPADLPRRPDLRPARLRAGRGRLDRGRIRETGRTNFAPGARRASD